MTAETIKKHLDWLRSIGQSDYVDEHRTPGPIQAIGVDEAAYGKGHK